MIWGYTEVEGWFYTNKWNYYQRCEGNVVAYIERMFGFYRVHVTYRGVLSMCDIEYRTEGMNFEDAKTKALELLDKYKDASNKQDLWNDYYSPYNPVGHWASSI